MSAPSAAERVGDVAALAAAPGRRQTVRLASGRWVLLLQTPNDGIVCIDERCYHHGAPLSDADIEDVGGRCIVVCPWHRYKIAIDSGECLYQGVDIVTGAVSWKSKGVKQRPHVVDVRRDGSIWVTDSSLLPEGAPAAAAVAAPVWGGGFGGSGGGDDDLMMGFSDDADAGAAAPAPAPAPAARLPPASVKRLESDTYAFMEQPPPPPRDVVPSGGGRRGGAGGGPLALATDDAPFGAAPSGFPLHSSFAPGKWR
jgi:nitrite reductase/ring-hydroxylating ferredoxin subunit